MKAIQAEETITFVVEAAADDAFPLFGPKREMDWDRDWRPTFLMPANGDQSPHGSVFVVRADGRESVWIMTVYDAARRAVQYVRVTPGHTTGQIWISITSLTAASSQAKVSYRLTGLSPTGNQFVQEWAQQFPQMGSAWAEVINHYLRTQTAHPTPAYDVPTSRPTSAS